MTAVNHNFFFKNQDDQELELSHPITERKLNNGLKWMLGKAKSPGEIVTIRRLFLHSIMFNAGYNKDNVFKLMVIFVQDKGSHTIDIPRMTRPGLAANTENCQFFNGNKGLEIDIPTGTKEILYQLINTGNVVFDCTLTVKYE